MPDEDKAKPKVGEQERSFKPGEEDGYQADTFSRGDAEGVPAEDRSHADELVEDEGVLKDGEAGGYQTDALSRGDEEGAPQENLRAPSPQPAGAAQGEASHESTQRKAVDDADSRDAPPMAGPEGGVR